MSIRIGKRITAVIFAAALMTSSGSMVLAAKSTQKTTSSVQKKTVQVTAASGTYYVSSDIGLNVRKGPSTASARIGGLYMGDQVTVTGRVMENGKKNGWVRIKYNNGSAYIWEELSETKPTAVAASNSKVDENGVSEATKKQQSWITFRNNSNTTRIKAARGARVKGDDVFTVDVKKGYLALRSSADSTSSNIIAELQKDVSVTVETYGTQFDYVYVPSINKSGYVNNDYLK